MIGAGDDGPREGGDRWWEMGSTALITGGGGAGFHGGEGVDLGIIGSRDGGSCDGEGSRTSEMVFRAHVTYRGWISTV